MHNPNPWARHFQIAWENRAANSAVPLWARIVALAYGHHEANGHANFDRGQLSWLLGKPATDAEPFKRRDKSSVRDAIRTAIKYGWLAEESCAECLVVPYGEIEGPNGNPHKVCRVHARKAELVELAAIS